MILLWLPVKAQYDGSFNTLYFNRSIDAKSESMGSITASFFNNAFSVHQNSSLIGFQDGYGISYSYSSPYYLNKNGRFDYTGFSAKLFKNIAFGVSRYTYKDPDNALEQRLSTLAIIYKFNQSFSIGLNGRLLYWSQGNRTDETGSFLKEAVSKKLYFDITSSAKFPYSFSRINAHLIAGITFENIFYQQMKLNFGSIDSSIELPAIITISANNEFSWDSGIEFILIKNISLNILGEYQNVINYGYKTRYSIGSQISLNKILEIRAGYYYETNNDYGFTVNKSYLSEFTYGIGANIPLSNILNIDKSFSLSIDFTKMQQPLYTTRNLFGIGDFTMISAALKFIP